MEVLNQADICIGRLFFSRTAFRTDIIIREMNDVVRAVAPPEERGCVVGYHVVSLVVEGEEGCSTSCTTALSIILIAA
jgi:hypothetical protein